MRGLRLNAVMRNTKWIAVAAAVAIVCAPAGRPALAARGQSLSLGLGVSTYYDDNLLQYSDAQLSTFHSGLEPEQFSIHASDDVVYRPNVSLIWERDGTRGRGRVVRLRAAGEFHKENATADFRSWSAVWRESLSRDRRLTVSGYWLPRYYLRQLYDDDAPVGPTRYRRARFALAIGSLAWRQLLIRRARLEASYQYERRSYNAEFVERASSAHQGVLGLEWYRLPRRGAVDLYGGYRLSKAKGEDGDETPGVPLDDPDVSYHGIVAGLGGTMDLARGDRWRLGGDANYELGTRDYDSDRPADKYHFNRSDLSQTVDLALRWSVRRWAVRGFYRFDHNRADLGAVAPPSADTGSYTENQVGLALSWSGPIWRQSRGGPRREEDESP